MFQFALSKANRMKCFANSFCFGWTRWVRERDRVKQTCCFAHWTDDHQRHLWMKSGTGFGGVQNLRIGIILWYSTWDATTHCWLKIRLHSIRSKPTNVTEFEWPGCPASVVYCCFIARNDSSTNTLSRCQPEWMQLFQLCKLQVNCKKLQMEKVKRPTVNQFTPS